jgi:hypothetical protein
MRQRGQEGKTWIVMPGPASGKRDPRGWPYIRSAGFV